MVHVIILMSDGINNTNEIPVSIKKTEIDFIFNNIINAFVGELSYTVVCFDSHLKNTNMKDIINNILEKYSLISIEDHNKGVLYTLSNINNIIDDYEEVIITYCDFIINWSYYNFLLSCRIKNMDGCIPSYKGFHPLKNKSDNYGYIKIDKNNYITDISYEDNINDIAIAGIYYSKHGNYIKKYIDLSDNLDKKKGLSYLYKRLIDDKLNIGTYSIDHILRLSPIDNLSYFNKKCKILKNIGIYDSNDNKYWTEYFNKYVSLIRYNIKCIVFFHQGWGDLISCNAIIKYISSQFSETIIIMRKDAYDMFTYCFNNLKQINNIKFLYLDKSTLDNRNNIYKLIIEKNKNNEYVILTFGNYLEHLNTFKGNNGKFCINNTKLKYSYSQGFYNSYNIDLSVRFNYFHVERDTNIENLLYNKVISNINSNKYILKHDDSSRDIIITKLDSKLPIINLNGISSIMYDTLKIIENAEEIHLIDSSYSIMIYYMQNSYNFIKNKKIFMHKYARPVNDYTIYNYPKPNWIFIE
jgi:hypothetical protein